MATGFAGRGGVSLYVNGVWTPPARGREIDNRKVRSVYEDHAGRIWLGYDYGGIAARAKDGWRQLRFSDGLAGEEGKVVRQDSNGTYWIGTSNGLSVIRRDAWVSVGLVVKPGQAGRYSILRFLGSPVAGLPAEAEIAGQSRSVANSIQVKRKAR